MDMLFTDNLGNAVPEGALRAATEAGRGPLTAWVIESDENTMDKVYFSIACGGFTFSVFLPPVVAHVIADEFREAANTATDALRERIERERSGGEDSSPS